MDVLGTVTPCPTRPGPSRVTTSEFERTVAVAIAVAVWLSLSSLSLSSLRWGGGGYIPPSPTHAWVYWMGQQCGKSNQGQAQDTRILSFPASGRHSACSYARSAAEIGNGGCHGPRMLLPIVYLGTYLGT